MSTTLDTVVVPRLRACANNVPLLDPSEPPRRTAPFDFEPGYHLPAKLWLYGNAHLLAGELAFLEIASGPPHQDPDQLSEIERRAEELVLAGKILVCGIHNPAQMRAATLPLRWGAPRILVLSGGFIHHLGPSLNQEPFRAARLWRYQWDPKTDLAISRRAPGKLPTFALHNPTVDRLVAKIAQSECLGLRWRDKGSLRVLA